MSGSKIAGAAVKVSAITMISRVLGYIRDALSAALFGVGMISDAFFVAFRIPNMLRDLMAEGALSSAFLPVFTEHVENKKDVWRLANNVLTVLTIILLIIVILGMIFAPFIVNLIAPGFSKDPEKFALTVSLTRILFPFIMLVSLAAIFMGILNSFKSFSVPAFAPVVFNIGIIIFGVFICPRFKEGNQIYAWAAGAIFGAALQLVVQIPPVIKKGFAFKPVLDLKDKGLQRVGKLMIPATLGQSVTQINLVVNTIIASFLTAGSVSYLYYGNRLMQLPLGVFGVAIATVSFSYISTYVANGDMENLRKTLNSSIKQALFIVVPASAGMIFLSRQINMLLFYYGKFTYVDVINSANVSAMYCLGIFAFSGTKILTPVFYALDKAHKAVKIGIMTIGLNIVLSIIFVLVLPKDIAFIGLALAMAISGIVNFFVLYYTVEKQIGDIGRSDILAFAGKIAAASVLMGLIIFLGAGYIEKLSGLAQLSRLQNGLLVLGLMIIGAIIYFLLVSLMKVEEGGKLINLLKGKIIKKP
ncbi:MAG: murein biosynthesis integral membrane protein MurJ [bacterium]